MYTGKVEVLSQFVPPHILRKGKTKLICGRGDFQQCCPPDRDYGTLALVLSLQRCYFDLKLCYPIGHIKPGFHGR